MPQAITTGFDVDAARKSGYSDDEILSHMTKSRKFDIQGALKSGYSSEELIQHLSTAKRVDSTSTSTDLDGPPKFPTSFMNLSGETVRGQDPLQARPYQAPKAETIRGPLSFMERAKNLGRDVIERAPEISTLVGGIIGSIPGAGVGAMAGKTITNLFKAGGMGTEPPPETAIGELADVGGAGIKGVAEQAIGKAIHYGIVAPAINKTVFPKASKSARLFSDAVGGRRSVQIESDIQSSFETAKPYLKRSEREFLKGSVVNKREAIEVGKDAYQRIYNEDIRPFIDATPEVDFRPLADQLKSQIPEHFTVAERLKASKTIDAMFNKKLDGRSAEALRQKLRAEDKVNLAKNNYERAAVEKTARGWVLGKMYEAARNHVADTVKTFTGHDIRPALGNYGAASDVTQHMLGSPVDRSLLQHIEGTYFTGSPYNIRGRATQLAGGMLKSSDRYIRKAFSNIGESEIAPTPPPRLALPAPADTSYVRGIDARFDRLALPPAPPTLTDIQTAPLPTGQFSTLSGGKAQTAPSLPLPSRKTGLDYGKGRYSDEMPNYQYTGEVAPSPLQQPEQTSGILRTRGTGEHFKSSKEQAKKAKESFRSGSFPRNPKIGDKFLKEGQTWTYTNKGWTR